MEEYRYSFCYQYDHLGNGILRLFSHLPGHGESNGLGEGTGLSGTVLENDFCRSYHALGGSLYQPIRQPESDYPGHFYLDDNAVSFSDTNDRIVALDSLMGCCHALWIFIFRTGLSNMHDVLVQY